MTQPSCPSLRWNQRIARMRISLDIQTNAREDDFGCLHIKQLHRIASLCIQVAPRDSFSAR